MTNMHQSKVRFVYLKRLFVKLSNVIYNLMEKLTYIIYYNWEYSILMWYCKT